MGVWFARFVSALSISVMISAQAETIHVSPTENLQAVLDNSQAGDQIVLSKGIYQGNFVLPQSIELTGEKGAVLDGQNKGHALQISQPLTYVHHLRIQNWGDDLTDMNAGIFVAKSAATSRIEHNYLHGGGFGIWVDATPDVQIISNKVEGDLNLRSSDRGNGIHLFNVKGLLAQDNEVWHTRDGIYIDTSNGNKLIGNYLHDLRYGVHYMYSYHNLVQDNFTYQTRTGYALMQSKFLTVIGNRSKNDANYGILMNYITNSTIENNRVEGIQNTRNPHMQQSSSQAGLEGKALFIYNSLFNKIRDNLFAESDMGIHLTAGSEDNVISGNAFVSNKEQVKYVATRKQDWSDEGVGNFWSDYLGWDMDGDGIGDVEYEPNDSVDRLLWKFPSAKLLLNSPAVETLRWVQRQFPVLKSPGVVDSHPLMAVPDLLEPSGSALGTAAGQVAEN
ncbi:nitrous oxide reductase family maturation protein NosD [Pontibacterium sp. N1Y112]|uniref:Nitrous oxide reductase family maturation protein NosD n=1 Tax=Pontibacterium sinense TaxID=2781979 RepID=A0A8J7K630_9GAMM|nr:nitrous oxide reductase family maturation protein NosD [Pontibacterium sinense]MBE9397850.1 nitrous oxide reductase family maturation protein NosD [Pontibacterium sinense]